MPNRRDAALPPAFSLLKSEFNDFLFAPIGDEDAPGALSVLSAFSRAGIDPWREAASLAQLPRDTATQKLSAILVALPDRTWSATDAQSVAGHLIELLPRRPSPTSRLSASARSILARLSQIVSRQPR